MKSLEKDFPPYAGDKPYMHLCFSEDSVRKVAPLLRRLRERGVRVWYRSGYNADAQALKNASDRMMNAKLTVIFLDEALRNDPDAKSRLMLCQQSEQKLICLNTDGGDSGLSISIDPEKLRSGLFRVTGSESAENALIRAEGFSQDLIGTPVIKKRRLIWIVTGILLALAVATLAIGAAKVLLRPNEPQSQAAPLEELPKDTVDISDDVIREAIRDELNGAALTPESLRAVTSLRIPSEKLPEDLSALKELPSLETIEITQSAALEVQDRTELSDYRIELFGGADR